MSLAKSIKQKIIETNIETLESSSVHAIPNIIRSKFRSVKILWTVCFLASVGVCAWFIYQSISNYFNFDVVTNIQLDYVNRIKFPIISICLIGLEQSINLNTELLSCKFQNYDCSLQNDFELFQDSFHGICLRFNSGKNMMGKTLETKYSYAKGNQNSLNMEFFLYNTGSSSESGLIIYITDEITDSFKDVGLYISTGQSTRISINKYKVVKQQQPYSNCIADLTSINSYHSEFYKKIFSNDKIYKFSDCSNMCLQKIIGDDCGFQVNELGKSYYNEKSNFSFKIIGPNEFNCSFSSLKKFRSSSENLLNCDCPLECESSGYTYTLSHANYPTTYYTNELINNYPFFKNLSQIYGLDNFKEKFSSIEIFFEEMKETVIKQEIKTQLSDLISNIGGTLGLFLGFNFNILIMNN
jgi:hypothetical protein